MTMKWSKVDGRLGDRIALARGETFRRLRAENFVYTTGKIEGEFYW